MNDEPKSLTAFYNQILFDQLVVDAVEKSDPGYGKAIIEFMKCDYSLPFQVFRAHQVVHDTVLAHSLHLRTIQARPKRNQPGLHVMMFKDVFWLTVGDGKSIGFFSSGESAVEYVEEMYGEAQLI